MRRAHNCFFCRLRKSKDHNPFVCKCVSSVQIAASNHFQGKQSLIKVSLLSLVFVGRWGLFEIHTNIKLLPFKNKKEHFFNYVFSLIWKLGKSFVYKWNYSGSYSWINLGSQASEKQENLHSNLVKTCTQVLIFVAEVHYVFCMSFWKLR